MYLLFLNVIVNFVTSLFYVYCIAIHSETTIGSSNAEIMFYHCIGVIVLDIIGLIVFYSLILVK